MAVFLIRKSCLPMSFLLSVPRWTIFTTLRHSCFFSCESNLHRNFLWVLFVNLDVRLKLAEVVSAILTATWMMSMTLRIKRCCNCNLASSDGGTKFLSRCLNSSGTTCFLEAKIVFVIISDFWLRSSPSELRLGSISLCSRAALRECWILFRKSSYDEILLNAFKTWGATWKNLRDWIGFRYGKLVGLRSCLEGHFFRESSVS